MPPKIVDWIRYHIVFRHVNGTTTSVYPLHAEPLRARHGTIFGQVDRTRTIHGVPNTRVMCFWRIPSVLTSLWIRALVFPVKSSNSPGTQFTVVGCTPFSVPGNAPGLPQDCPYGLYTPRTHHLYVRDVMNNLDSMTLSKCCTAAH